MGLLSTLKSLLGMEEEGGSAGSGVDVTVEREPSAESERAVKEPDEEVESEFDEADDGATADEAERDAEPVGEPEGEATEDEAAEDETGKDETAGDGAAGDDVEEPAAAETDDASTESFIDEDHTDDPTPPAEPVDAEEGGDAGEGEPVTVLKGIGPAYGDRLSDAGVDTVEELAAADVEDLAERVDLSPKRVGRWVETAQSYE